MNNFYRTKVIYKILEAIAQERETLKSELVAYGNDSIRYKRRLRMLINLAEYELNTLIKIRNFETIDPLDYDTAMHNVLQEINSIVDRDA